MTTTKSEQVVAKGFDLIKANVGLAGVMPRAVNLLNTGHVIWRKAELRVVGFGRVPHHRVGVIGMFQTQNVSNFVNGDLKKVLDMCRIWKKNKARYMVTEVACG